jgi:hypothetical protein
MVATLDKSPVQAKGIEVFRAGLQTDSDGNSKVWTIPELDEFVEAYNDAASKAHKAPAIPAPIQIGHEEDPVFQQHGSYGWVEKAYRQGDTVLVDYTKVDPAFAEMVNNGTYLHRSISLYPREHPGNPTPGRLNIRHVAYVRYPAIKGLAEHSFSEPDGGGYINFSFPSQETLDYATVGVSVFNALGAIANLMARQRERVIEMEGLERADEDFPEDLINMIRSEAANPPSTDIFATVGSFDALAKYVSDIGTQVSGLILAVQALTATPPTPPSDLDNYPQYSEPPQTTVSTSPSEASLPTAVEQQFQEMRAQISALQADLHTSQSRVRELENLNIKRERQVELEGVANFIETAISKRQVLPCDKAKTINFIMKLSNKTEDGFEFSEGDGESVQKSPRQVYLDEIAARPPLWSDKPMPSSTESGQNFFSEAELAAKAQTLQKEFKDKGLHKPLSECIDLVESGRTTA